MGKILFIEGIDGVGKTTLAKYIAKRMGFKYFKNPIEKKIKFNEKDIFFNRIVEAEYLLALLEILDENIIFDRSIVSEYVYSHTFSRFIDDDIIFDLDEKFAKKGVFLIFCHKGIDVLKQDFAESYNFDLVFDLMKYYNMYLHRTKMNFVEIDMSNRDLESQFSIVRKCIFEHFEDRGGK